MITRKSILVVFTGIVGCMMGACNDTQENDYEEESQKVSKYVDADEAFEAIDVLYKTGVPTFYGESRLKEGPIAAIGGYLSGFFDNEAKIEAKLCDYCQHLTLDEANLSGCFDEMRAKAYVGVCKSEEAIENIPYTKSLTNDQKDRLLAEATFFRAFNYFYLVRAFGEIPLIQNSEQGTPDASMPKSSLAEVYQQIVKDLKVSIPSLPDSAFTENNYRICRTTAETVLADVYLTMSGYPLKQNHYKEAADLARDVIASGKHALIPNGLTEETSAYNVLRTENNHSEYIYTYKTGQRKVGESFTAFAFSKEAGSWGALKTAQTNNAYQPTQAFLNLYDSVYDSRMHEQQFFHSFFKYDKQGKTVIETFSQAPFLWFDQKAAQETGISDKDLIIYRYAEVLLIAAEAIARTEGVTAEAVDYLARVRARAYTQMDKSKIESELATMNCEKFIEEVWLERMREFPLEMKIWQDMQRTRKYPVASAQKKGTAVFKDIIGVTNSWGAVFAEKHLLLPWLQ